MGPIDDRTKEHLGTADLAVITTRRLLIQAAQDVQQGRAHRAGRAAEQARPAEILLPHGTPWAEAMQPELVALW